MLKLKLLFILIVSLSFNANVFSQSIAITNANLINVNDGKVLNNTTILIENNLIKEVGKTGKIKIPTDAQVIDAKGKWIIPGMVDAHIHFFQSGGLYTRPDLIDLRKFYPYEKDQQWIKDNREDLMRRYLACGITTVMDVGGPMSNFDVRKYCNETAVSPNAFVTGTLISTSYKPNNLDTSDPPIIKVNTEEEARVLVRKQLPYKPDFIKVLYNVRGNDSDAQRELPIVKAVVDESHKNNLKVCVHATGYGTAKLAVEASCDILVHSVDDKVVDDNFLQSLKTKNVTYISALLVHSKYTEVVSQQHRLYSQDFKYANPFELGTLFDLQHISKNEVSFDYEKIRARRKLPTSSDTVRLKNLKLVVISGVNVVTGTDAGNSGTSHAASYLTELQNMRLAGMNNAQILKSSTINAARGFGKEKELGSIEKGKLADLLILNKNPLENIESVNDIFLLIHRGKTIQTDTLIKITPESLAQQQLNAYNARNIDAFLEPYSDSVKIYRSSSDKPIMNGKDDMRKAYADLFDKHPNLHCQLVNRMVKDNIIIDQESITGFKDKPIKGIAVYTISNNKIQKVQFL